MGNENQNNAGQVNLADASDVTSMVTPNIDQGVPDVVNVDPNIAGTPEAPVGTLKPEDGTQTPKDATEAPDAVAERLKQQNAQQAKLLSSLGIDPLSDIGEQLEKGLITEDMIRAHVAAKYKAPETPVVPETTTPVNELVTAAEAEQQAALEAYNKEVADTGGVTLDTNNRLRQADLKLNDAKLSNLTQQITAEKEASNKIRQVNENVKAVISVAHEIPEFAEMDAPLQQATEQVSLALTGMLADSKAREMGIDPVTLNVQQYQYFAGEANTVLAGLAEHYRNLGRAEAKVGFVPPVVPGVNTVNAPTPAIVPANADGSPIPTANPYANTGVMNHEAAAKDFAAKNRAVI